MSTRDDKALEALIDRVANLSELIRHGNLQGRAFDRAEDRLERLQDRLATAVRVPPVIAHPLTRTAVQEAAISAMTTAEYEDYLNGENSALMMDKAAQS